MLDNEKPGSILIRIKCKDSSWLGESHRFYEVGSINIFGRTRSNGSKVVCLEIDRREVLDGFEVTVPVKPGNSIRITRGVPGWNTAEVELFSFYTPEEDETTPDS